MNAGRDYSGHSAECKPAFRSPRASSRKGSLEPRQELGYRQTKGIGEHFQIANADFLLSVLQVRNETAVYADVLGHVDLRPSSLLAEGA